MVTNMIGRFSLGVPSEGDTSKILKDDKPICEVVCKDLSFVNYLVWLLNQDEKWKEARKLIEDVGTNMVISEGEILEMADLNNRVAKVEEIPL